MGGNKGRKLPKRATIRKPPESVPSRMLEETRPGYDPEDIDEDDLDDPEA